MKKTNRMYFIFSHGIACDVLALELCLMLRVKFAQILCPVFGYQRNYHAYAFRKAPDPWLGPTKCSSLDMAQVLFVPFEKQRAAI